MLLIFLALFVWSYYVFLRSEYEDSCRIYVICVRLRIVVSSTYCVVFLCFVCLRPVYPTFIFALFLVYQVLPVALDCPILITPSVFSNVYFHPPDVASVSGLSILDCPFGFL
jgi:hypothetical protein